MIRRNKSAITVLLLLAIGSQLMGAVIAEERLVNNTSATSDYKMDTNESNSIFNSIRSSVEVHNDSTVNDTKIKTSDEVLDGLISDNILNRDNGLDISKQGIIVKQGSIDKKAEIKRTEALIYLDKIRNGSIGSRPFVIKVNTVDNNETTGDKASLGTKLKNYVNRYRDITDATNYDIYVNNNIPELYLTRLLQNVTIKEDEISNKKFISEYTKQSSKDVSTVPEWSNSLQPYIYNDSEGNPTNQLGSGWEFSDFFRIFTKKASTFKATKKSSYNFFVNESVNRLEVYDYIYGMFKGSLKQFSDEDRQYLVLKYGSKEISALSLDEQNKMYTLIYNGIINREDTEEVSNLNNLITGNFLYEILYRLKHENERIKIEIQKLDNQEKSLAQEGFVRNDVSIYDGMSQLEPITLSVKRLKDGEDAEKSVTGNNWYIPIFGDKDGDNSASEAPADLPWYTKLGNAVGTGLTYQKNSIKDFVDTRVEETKNAGQDYKDGKISGWDYIKKTNGFTTVGKGLGWYGNAIIGNDAHMQEKVKADYESKPVSQYNENKSISDKKEVEDAKDTNENKDTSTKTETKEGKVAGSTEDKSAKPAEQTSNKEDQDLGANKVSSIGATVTEEPANYQVIKVFPNPDKVEYKGIKIKDVTPTSPKDGNVSSVTKTSKDAVKITFKLKASSDVEALAVIDSVTTYDVDSENVKSLQTVTRVQGDKRGAVYMSAKEMEKSMGELVVVSNKVLKNKKTGAVAVLLTDHHKAMIGNRVISTDEPIVITNTADTYYNMEFLAPLMSNAYITSIDPEKLFLDNKLPIEAIAQVKCSTNDLEKTMIIESQSWDSGLFGANERYFNLDMVTRGISCLTRELNIEGKKAYVIIDWAYSLPDNDSTILDYFNDSDLSVKDASKFLFTKPASGTSQEWWESNIELSNGLANALYNTTNIPYITSGYLKPDVTVLLPKDGTDEATVNTYLKSKLNLTSTYLAKYCDKDVADFQIKLFNSGAGDPTGRRSYKVLKGETSRSTEANKKPDVNKYDEDYVTTATGAIYRNIKKDKRMSYDPTSNVLNVSGRELNNDSNELKSTIKIGGKAFHVQKPGSTSFSSYLAITDIDGISGKSTPNSKQNYDLSGDTFDAFDKVKDKITEDMGVIKGAVDGCEDADFKALDKYEGNEYSIKLSEDYYKKDTKYMVEGNMITGTATNISNPLQGIIATNTFNSNAIVMPTIYLDASKYSIVNGELVKKLSLPYLEQGNVLFSGLNSTLMSRLIDKSAEVIPYKDLPDKANVIIQDVTYIKTSHGLESMPIQDVTFATELAGHAMEANTINSLIVRRFEGLQLLFSGRPVSFTSYITKCGIGTLEFEDTNKTYYYKGNTGFFSSEKGKEELYKSQALVSACISIDLDADTQFYLLDGSTNTYEIRYASDKYCDGYIDNVSAFSEDLGFGVAQDNMLELKNNNYNPDADYKNLFKESQLVYQSMLKGDIISILQFTFTLVICYIILVTWIGLVILKGNVGLSILLNIRNPSGVKGAEGFDFIKIVSAGVWNLDSDPKVPLVVLADLLLFTLLYLVIDCGTIIKCMFY